MMSVEMRLETPADFDAIRQVNELAFGQQDEARLVDTLRDGGYVRLSLVALASGEVVGHILFSDLRIVGDSEATTALALAPMAVLPAHQRSGIGSALVRRGLDLCREADHEIVIVLGHPHFYPRFGFSSELARSLRSPYSAAGDAWMALELAPGALKGVSGEVQYPPPFAGF